MSLVKIEVALFFGAQPGKGLFKVFARKGEHPKCQCGLSFLSGVCFLYVIKMPCGEVV